MIQADTIPWFARHEGRLAWRDLLWLLSGGRRRRGAWLGFGLAVFVLFLHGVAYLSLLRFRGLSGPPSKPMLVAITGVLAIYGSLMLSQAVEAVTRAFYGRADLDLILSSPAAAARLFAVRILAMAASIMVMALGLAAPFIDMLAWLGGARWLAAYGVVAALAMVAVAVAVAVTAALFRTIGPRSTRLVAQIIAAVIGAGFVIGVQFAAILSIGTLSRTAFLQSQSVIDHAPDIASILWWPARAVAGELPQLVAVLGIAAVALAVVVGCYASQFETIALTAAGMQRARTRRHRGKLRFPVMSPAQVLRRKEWTLLWRDPWLVSQSLMQLLYLLPPAFLLWRSFYDGARPGALLVPVLIMAAGQLAGGLAWLAISGEDAPDLIASAPVPAARVVRAKTDAVMAGVAIVFAPFIAALAIADPPSALVGVAGIAVAALSATLIQFRFRHQARRSQFRRRQVSSRLATIAEALSSIIWASVGGLAAYRSWFAVVPAVVAIAIIAGTWLLGPSRRDGR